MVFITIIISVIITIIIVLLQRKYYRRIIQKKNDGLMRQILKENRLEKKMEHLEIERQAVEKLLQKKLDSIIILK